MRKNRALLFLAFWMAASGCLAQQARKQATVADTNSARLDLFAGYSSWHPHGTVNGYAYNADNAGMLFSGAYYFGPRVALNGRLGAQFEGERQQQTATEGMRAFSFGPIYRVPAWRQLSVFTHFLVGAAGVTGPNQPTLDSSSFYFNPEHWGVMLTLGGGLDYRTPLLHHHLAIRVLQADYQYLHVDFGPPQRTTGGRANIDAARLSTGIVYSFDRLSFRHRPHLPFRRRSRNQ